MRFTSRNPVLNRLGDDRMSTSHSYVAGEAASFTGISTKTGILLMIIIGISAFLWMNPDLIANYTMPLLIVAVIGGFVSVLLASFTRATAFFTILYAIFEGVLLGTITFAVQQVEPGLVFNAVTITFAIFMFLLVAYATGLFKVGFRFRKIVYTMMFSLIIFYLFAGIFSLIGLNFFTVSFELLLIMTIGMIILASFNLLIDFDNCKIAVDQGLPKKYEWRLSLGLLVSLVWLYIEVLRLLLLLASRARD